MGQRLNITITDNGKRLANAYYHWSAYTSESAGLAKKIIDFIREPKLMTENDKLSLQFGHGFKELADYSDLSSLEKAIFLLNYTGSGFPEYEINNIIKYAREGKLPPIRDFLLKQTEGRNNGLTAITEEGMNETEDWEEGRVTIDIGTNRVNFDNFWRWEHEFDTEEEEAKFNNHPKVQCNFHFDNMTFDEFDFFWKELSKEGGEEKLYIDQSGNVFDCIY